MPAGTSGDVGADSVIDRARALLDRIKDGLKSAAKRGVQLYTAPDAWALRKAADALHSGAAKAAKLAREAKDAAAGAVRKIADEAWQVAQGPLLLAALAYLAFNGGSSSSREDNTPLLAGLAYLATRAL